MSVAKKADFTWISFGLNAARLAANCRTLRWRETYFRQIRQVAETVESCFDCDLFDFDKPYDLLGSPGVENALRPRNQQTVTWDHIDVDHRSRCPLKICHRISLSLER